MPEQRVYTIPASQPFLKTLAQKILNGRFFTFSPELLARTTLYLPHTRACRRMADLFFELSKKTILLPKIIPLGEIDDEASSLLTGSQPPIPDEIHPLKRKVLLAKAIIKWRNSTESLQNSGFLHAPQSAFALAGDLMQVIDQLETERIELKALANLDLAELDMNWQISSDFLSTLFKQLPESLAALNVLQPAKRRDLLLKKEAERLKTHPFPIIAAGSTGSIDATRDLLKSLSQNPQGHVVLPNLDIYSDDENFNAIGHENDNRFFSSASYGHPQFSLKRLITHLDVSRREGGVVPLEKPAPHGRERLLAHALRDAENSEAWSLPLPIKEHELALQLQDLILIEADDGHHEALCIASYFAKQAEQPFQGLLGALVTPNRTLALRVKAALARFGLTCDVSSGIALQETPAFALMGYVLEFSTQFDTSALYTLLASPYFELERHEKTVEMLDIIALRGIAPHDFASLKARLSFQDRHIKRGSILSRVNEDARLEMFLLIEKIEILLTPFMHKSLPLQAWSGLMLAHFMPLISPQCEGFEALQASLEKLASEDFEESFNGEQALFVFKSVLGDDPVARAGDKEAAIRILGLPEARLLDVPHIVLGGLNEGVFPPLPQSGAFLNRLMMTQLGLDPPERRIGLTAHDFSTLLGHKNCVLTRSLKEEGVPSVPSRWLSRLEAVIGEPFQALKERGLKYARFASHLDQSEVFSPAVRPQPKPPQIARPTTLSITEIGKLKRDPYAIYAEHILNLVPLEPHGRALDGRERGLLLHKALELYSKSYALKKPQDPYESLCKIGFEVFSPYFCHADVKNLWWPRFLRMAQSFITYDEAIRKKGTHIAVEESGSLVIKLTSGRDFTLRGRADRFEMKGQDISIVDFKSGSAPSKKQLENGFEPQLILEMLMVEKGAFKKINGEVEALKFIEIKGGGENFKEKSYPQNHEDKPWYWQQFTQLINDFEAEDKPYTSRIAIEKINSEGYYDHLARANEWANEEEGGEDE